MSRTAQTIGLSPEEQATLETWAHGRSLPARLVQRAQIIRLAAGGTLNQDIARELRI
jgi:DNA-binding NarL/FixJ family response regulator